jgi:5,10-methylenetetrahydromethanopterin reductase
MAIRFSLAGNAGERGFQAQVERAVEMEELGYDGIFFSESLMSGLDPFQVLTAAALRTERIHLGTAIMTMTFREPVVLANQAATLNEISNGRAILGLGTGDGTTYTMAREAMPLTRFAKGVRMIRELVNGRTIHIPEGKEREAGDLPLRAGRFPVPVWMAAAGPRALRTAGAVADGVILGSGFDLRVVDWAKEQVAQGARDAGRDPSEIELIGAGIVCVDDDGERARRIACGRLANRAHQNFRFTLETVPPEERPGVQKFMDAFDVTKRIDERSDPGLITDYLQQRFAIAGTPEECAQRIGELARRGIKNFLLTLPPKVYYEVMRKWAAAVMPRLRIAQSPES